MIKLNNHLQSPEQRSEQYPLEYVVNANRNKNNGFIPSSSEKCEKVCYPENSAILCWINKEVGGFDTHWHPSIEIIMPLDNVYSVRLNRATFLLEEGDILIIPPGELHELSASSSGMRLILLFDYTVISQLKGFSSIWSLFSSPTLITAQNSPNIYDKVKDILLSIADEYINDTPLWELSIYALFIQFFIQINQSHIDSSNLLPYISVNKQREYLGKFNTVFDYIDKNYMEDLDLETIAAAAGFSKYHFSRLFKQFTNNSFYNYLISRRIRAAETLLHDTALSITDIALMSGFSSISTFNRVFKEFKKCTPTEFKKFCNAQNLPLSNVQ